MKRIQLILAAIAAIAATIAGLDLTGFVTVLPPEMAKWLVIIPSAAAAIVHIVQAVKLQLEKIGEDIDKLIPLFCIGMFSVVFLPSCVTSTAPDGTETKRVDQEAVNPWLLLARDLFVNPDPPVAPIVVTPEK